MITKNISKYLAMFLVGFGLAATTSCSTDNDAFFTAGEDDMPRILNTDIPEGKGGEPGTIANIERTENFVFDVQVTPADYTTVSWLIDDEKVFEGLSINQPVLAGDHILKIVATTTKGLSTSRTCLLKVRPLAGDPYPNRKDIHETLVKQGTTATIHGDNMSKVAKIIINGQEIAATYNAAGDYVEYTVPAVADGTYFMKLVDADGFIYGGGLIEINENPEYPVGGEQELWSGSHAIDWSTPWEASEDVNAALKKKAAVGSILRLYVTRTADDYCQGCAAVGWRNICTGYSDDDADKDVTGGRGDTPFDGTTVLEFKLTEKSMELLEDGKLQVVGHGFDLTKITIETPVETELWAGSHAVDWSTPWENADATTKLKSFAKVGTTVHIYVERTADDYCQACVAVGWRNICTGYSDDDADKDVTGGRGDTPFDGTTVLDFVLTEKSMELLETGTLQVVGHGFNLLKVTAE